MIDMCCVGSGVKSHSLSHWSIVMTSPVEFSSGEFRANQKKNNNKGLFSKSKKSIVSVTFSVKARLIRTLWHGVASVTHSGFVQIFGSKIQEFFQTFFQNNIFSQTQNYQIGDQ